MTPRLDETDFEVEVTWAVGPGLTEATRGRVRDHQEFQQLLAAVADGDGFVGKYMALTTSPANYPIALFVRVLDHKPLRDDYDRWAALGVGAYRAVEDVG